MEETNMIYDIGFCILCEDTGPTYRLSLDPIVKGNMIIKKPEDVVKKSKVVFTKKYLLKK